MILLLSYVGIAVIGLAYTAVYFVLLAFMVSGDGNNEQVFAWWNTSLSIIVGCCVVGAIMSTVKRPLYGVVCALMGGPAVGLYLFALIHMERAAGIAP